MRYLVLLASAPATTWELPDLDAATPAAPLPPRDLRVEIPPVTRVEGYGPQ
jgi:hypothetical protein